MVRAAWLLGSGLLLAVQPVRAQAAPLPSLPAPRVVALDSVAVAPQAFYTRTEATYFRVLVLADPREYQAAALPLARQLAVEFPDNSLFAVEYAHLAFDQGQGKEAKRAAQDILTRCRQGLGYEARAGRAAAYLLAYLRQPRHHNLARAEDLYHRCLVFAETAQLTQGGYYVFAAPAELAAQQADVATARRYHALVLEHATRRAPEAERARAYLHQHPVP